MASAEGARGRVCPRAVRVVARERARPPWGRSAALPRAPCSAEAAERRLPGVTPESWVARTPELRRCQLICQTIFLPIRNN